MVRLIFFPIFTCICNMLINKGLRNGPFRSLKRPVLQCEMGRFANDSGLLSYAFVLLLRNDKCFDVCKWKVVSISNNKFVRNSFH